MSGRPQASSEAVRSRLSQQATRDTKPELVLRRELHRRGLRYRVNYPVPGLPRRTIDIAFPRRKVAVFVDGCFWHGCPEHSVASKSNSKWWQTKLASNVKRDADTKRALETLGWHVERVWEHDLRAGKDAQLTAQRITDALPGRA